jgi:hypothetical protein
MTLGSSSLQKGLFSTGNNFFMFLKNASILRSAQAIRKHYPFDEDSTLVMDFACGTGKNLGVEIFHHFMA